MDVEYKESFRLTNGHPLGVSCLAFSPDRSLLASGGLEGNICVWEVRTQKLIASSTPKGEVNVSVLRCVWKPNRNDSFICGIQDGSIAEVTLTPSKISLVGIRAHEYPVERLAVQDDLVVSGAQKQVRVWKREADEKWVQIADLDIPSQSLHDTAEVLVTGVFFTTIEGGRNALLVAYMHHGLILYDRSTFALVRNVPYSGLIGDCDLHPDGSTLAISNCRGAFEIYRFQSGKRKTLYPPKEEHRPLPLVFVQAGSSLLTGSATGKARLWDLASKRVHNNLSSGKDTQVFAVAACQDQDLEKKGQVLLLATGVISSTSACDIIVWAAKPASSKSALKRVRSTTTTTSNPSILSYLYHYAGWAVTILLAAALIHLVLSPGIYGLGFYA